jgi:UDP-N-acetyl-D-mannosaminuronate dehydrogenase
LIHDPLFEPREMGALEAQVIVDLDSPQAAEVDAVVIQAWHRDFRGLDWRRFKRMRAVLDGRGAVSADGVRETGATYIAIGSSRSRAGRPK